MNYSFLFKLIKHCKKIVLHTPKSQLYNYFIQISVLFLFKSKFKLLHRTREQAAWAKNHYSCHDQRLLLSADHFHSSSHVACRRRRTSTSWQVRFVYIRLLKLQKTQIIWWAEISPGQRENEKRRKYCHSWTQISTLHFRGRRVDYVSPRGRLFEFDT